MINDVEAAIVVLEGLDLAGEGEEEEEALLV
jgi:hypothetical protein